MAKKRNASAAGTSISQDIHDLKTLNSDPVKEVVVKEVAELRKQIEHLCSRLDSLIDDREIPDSTNRDIPDSTDHNVLAHLLSSFAEAHSNVQIAEATYKAESANAELNAMEMPTLREQDAVESELELITEGSDVTPVLQESQA
ncbi:hypothetical protein MA16_Dca022677 [Dendrobium catenatum]|uniref:Uncharacterized protein n=1 Tax=Dendrobium catenatum TaxID=906689 RepID=A0A2I0W244_9ASPA|nr:hypothetical protein MA16_Dca022677 [Dendrobium catenatum]